MKLWKNEYLIHIRQIRRRLIEPLQGPWGRYIPAYELCAWMAMSLVRLTMLLGPQGPVKHGHGILTAGMMIELYSIIMSTTKPTDRYCCCWHASRTPNDAALFFSFLHIKRWSSLTPPPMTTHGPKPFYRSFNRSRQYLTPKRLTPWSGRNKIGPHWAKLMRCVSPGQQRTALPGVAVALRSTFRSPRTCCLSSHGPSL